MWSRSWFPVRCRQVSPPTSWRPVVIPSTIIDGQEPTRVLQQKKDGPAEKSPHFVRFVRNTYVLRVRIWPAYHIPSKHAPADTSRNLVAEAKKCYENCYAGLILRRNPYAIYKGISGTLANIFFCENSYRFRSMFFAPSIFWVYHIMIHPKNTRWQKIRTESIWIFPK